MVIQKDIAVRGTEQCAIRAIALDTSEDFAPCLGYPSSMLLFCPGILKDYTIQCRSEERNLSISLETL